MRWLERERGLSFDGYPELWQWSVDDLEAFWDAIWDFFEVQADGERGAGARQPRDARRRVVPRHAAELRRARLRRQGRRRDGDPPRLRAARAGRAELGRAAAAGRGDGGGAAAPRRRARRPRRRLPAEHPRGDRRLPRHRLDRRGLVELLARLRPGQRDRPLRPDRAQGAVRGRRLPLRRQGLRPPRDRRPAAGGDAEPGAHRRPPLPRPRARPLAAARRDRAGRSCRPTAPAPS